MKDISTPVPQNEVRTVIKKSLENAALVNYERLSEEARIEGNFLSVRSAENCVFFHDFLALFKSSSAVSSLKIHNSKHAIVITNHG